MSVLWMSGSRLGSTAFDSIGQRQRHAVDLAANGAIFSVAYAVNH